MTRGKTRRKEGKTGLLPDCDSAGGWINGLPGNISDCDCGPLEQEQWDKVLWRCRTESFTLHQIVDIFKYSKWMVWKNLERLMGEKNAICLGRRGQILWKKVSNPVKDPLWESLVYEVIVWDDCHYNIRPGASGKQSEIIIISLFTQLPSSDIT